MSGKSSPLVTAQTYKVPYALTFMGGRSRVCRVCRSGIYPSNQRQVEGEKMGEGLILKRSKLFTLRNIGGNGFN